MHEKIVFDTDFLLTAVRFKIDIFSELKKVCDFKYETYIVDKTLDELKEKKLNKVALGLLEKSKIKIIKTEKNKNVDNLLLGLKEGIVCTQDKALKKELKKQGRKIITIRQKKYLILR